MLFRLLTLSLLAACQTDVPHDAFVQERDVQSNGVENGLADDFGDTRASAEPWRIGHDLLPGESRTYELQGVTQSSMDRDVIDVIAPEEAMLTVRVDRPDDQRRFGVAYGMNYWSSSPNDTTIWAKDDLYLSVSSDRPGAWSLRAEMYMSFGSPDIDWTPYFSAATPLAVDAEPLLGSNDPVQGFTVYRIDVPASGAIVEVDGGSSTWVHVFDAAGTRLDFNDARYPTPFEIGEGEHYVIVTNGGIGHEIVADTNP